MVIVETYLHSRVTIIIPVSIITVSVILHIRKKMILINTLYLSHNEQSLGFREFC